MAPRASGGSTEGSTSASAPSRASTKPIRAVRAMWKSEEIMRGPRQAAHSFQPECSATTPPVIGV